MKNIIFTILMIALSNGFVFAQTEPLDTDGNGYRNISTLEELRWVSENDSSWSWKFELDNDINASDTRNWNLGDHDYNQETPDSAMGWIPIGNKKKFFQGVFEGNGYEIDSIYINRPNQKYVGFFGYIGGAEIRNIGVLNCDISGSGSVGGLMGANVSSIISTSCSTGSISGIGYVGGLVGYNFVSNLRNSYSRCSVKGNYYVGGLVADNSQSSSLINSYSTGSVSGTENVGGLVGHHNFSETYYSFWDTLTSGIDSSAGGPGCTGKSTSEMKTKATFTDAGWDFDDIWTIDSDTNDGYPYFRDIPSSILEYETRPEKNLLVYPNPADEYIEISIDGAHLEGGHHRIEIYDVLGNLVINYSTPSLLCNATPCSHPDLSGQEGNFKIDVSHLPKGVYFVRMGDKVEKFVKL